MSDVIRGLIRAAGLQPARMIDLPGGAVRVHCARPNGAMRNVDVLFDGEAFTVTTRDFWKAMTAPVLGEHEGVSAAQMVEIVATDGHVKWC